MTRKTTMIIQHNDTWNRIRRSDHGEGRNPLMVSQEQMTSIMLLVMHTLPEMKGLKQQMMRKTEVTIQYVDTS
jgi:hypothetical protein